MITPRFYLDQDPNSVTITIRAPYSDLQELEISVEDNVFIFVSAPYYLRLHLPGNIEENEQSKSAFDCDSGEFRFTFEKTTRGEHFNNLDLITTLLKPRIEIESDREGEAPIIVLTTDDENTTKTDVQGDGNDDLETECGFAMQGRKQFHNISGEFFEVFDVDPLRVPLSERHSLRLKCEQEKFSPDHYICDFMERDQVDEILKLRPPWTSSDDTNKFTNSELDFLKDLTNKEYKLTELQVKYAQLGLIDILYAFCYDRRSTEFEGSVESGWTISKIAATLCWLDVFAEPREVVVSGMRRSLIMPLYRNFELASKVFDDLKSLVKLGEKFIIKCLIEVYHIFLVGDCCRYILNNLFIKDYIVYIMKWDKNEWQKIVQKLDEIVIVKSDLGLNLSELEDDPSTSFSTLKIADSDSDDE